MALEERIKEMRKQKGISQEELADKVGVQRNTVWRWENAKASPMEALNRIAQALDTSIAYLMGETNDPKRHTTILRGNEGTGNPVYHKIFRAAKERVESNLVAFNPAHRTTIKVLPQEFSACCGDGIDWGNEAVEFDYAYVISDSELWRHSPIIAMTVVGDSMEPDISEGDVVLFPETPPELQYIPNGSTVVVNYDGRMIVRNIFTRGNEVTLKAWNPIYRDIHPDPEDENTYFKVCGQVLKVQPASRRPRSMV